MGELCVCGTRFAIGLMRCPRCQRVAPRFAALVKEEEVPRITVASGPSNAAAAPGEVGYIEPESTAAAVEIRGERGPEFELGSLPEGHVNVLRPYASMTLAELRELAKEQGKPTGGSKADLIARLDGDGIGQVVDEEQDEPEEVSA